MSDATLMTPRGSQRVTRDELARIEPPPATESWKPLKHSDLVDALHAELAGRGLEVRKEQYAVQHDGTRLFGTMDLAWQETEERQASIGLRTSNDKRMALQIAVGLKVLVCDNMCFAGDIIALKRKHTSGMNLPFELAGAVDRYQERFSVLTTGIERLKNTWASEKEAKVALHELFAQRILPLRLFHEVLRQFHDVEAPRYGSTYWALHNAATAHIKTMEPGPAFRATLRLGQLLRLN